MHCDLKISLSYLDKGRESNKFSIFLIPEFLGFLTKFESFWHSRTFRKFLKMFQNTEMTHNSPGSLIRPTLLAEKENSWSAEVGNSLL